MAITSGGVPMVFIAGANNSTGSFRQTYENLPTPDGV